MRHLVAVALIVLLVAGIAGIAQCDPTADKSGKFTIEIVPGWVQGQGTDLFDLTGANKIDQLAVTAEGVPAELNLALFKTVYVKQAKQSLKGFSLVTKGDTVVAGNPAGVWVYTALMDGVKIEFKNVVFFKGGKLYSIIFGTIPELYKKDVVDADKMLASWKWL